MWIFNLYNISILYFILQSFHSQQIQQLKMDPRLYHYEYRRPRLANPTYSSFNVSNSMTFFVNNPSSPKNLPNAVNSPNYSRNSYDLPQQNGRQNYVEPPQYREMAPQPSRDPGRQLQQPQLQYDSRQKSNSQLSNYGNNSLAFNEREIYNKQHSQFNIINLKPREVPDRMKQYPKLTLENKDDYYYKRVQQMRMRQANDTRNGSLPARQQIVAGKHTFEPEEGKNPNYYQYGRYFTPKMLNHADQVSNIL